MKKLEPEIHAVCQAIFDINCSGGSTLNSIYALVNKTSGTRKQDVEVHLEKACKAKFVQPGRRAYTLTKKGRTYCERLQRAADLKLAVAKKLKSKKLKEQ